MFNYKIKCQIITKLIIKNNLIQINNYNNYNLNFLNKHLIIQLENINTIHHKKKLINTKINIKQEICRNSNNN